MKNHTRPVRRAIVGASVLLSLALALPVLAVPSQAAPLTKPNRLPKHVEARSLLAAVQGGELLGTPPLSALVTGAGATLTSPDFWANWTHDVLKNNRVLLPLPTDVIKPDVVLPHVRVENGVTNPLPTATPRTNFQRITYQWAGRTRSVGEFLRDTNTDAILVARNGSLIAQAFANGYSASQTHHAWSMTKSYVSTLIGIAKDEGRIASLDDPVQRYIPELTNTAWKGTSIRNLLLMRSGMRWDEHTEKINENDQFLQWIDMALDYYSNGAMGRTRNEYLRDTPRVGPQGKKFNYNSANTQVLGWILESIYKRPLNEVLSIELWKPLGMQAPADLMTDRNGDVLGSMSLQALPADYVRFGEMMRNGGRAANGRQIVSSDWVRQATTGMLPAQDAGDLQPGAYGFQWWSGATPKGFQANGFQGQFTTVVPEQCVTAVRLAHTIQFSTAGEFGGQGDDEWQAVVRAVSRSVGGCA